MTTALVCPSCAAPAAESDAYCESCGQSLGREATPAVGGDPVERALAAEVARDPGGATVAALPCGRCGAAADQVDADGYCAGCGLRRRLTDHLEMELAGMAAVTDRGVRHPRNEDAVALRAGDRLRIIVVCDGVSQSANPDQASAAAASAVADDLARRLASLEGRDPDDVVPLLAATVAVAQRAVRAVPQVEPGGFPEAPSSTLVAAVITEAGIATLNVGDSRAYFVDAGRCLQISRDDSMAEVGISQGMSPAEAHAGIWAHSITSWIGADSPDTPPNTAAFRPDGPGLLLVCSDGLWNYFDDPARLLTLVTEGPAGEATVSVARRLVDAALVAGGSDNITVAVARVTQPEAAPPASSDTTEKPA